MCSSEVWDRGCSLGVGVRQVVVERVGSDNGGNF